MKSKRTWKSQPPYGIKPMFDLIHLLLVPLGNIFLRQFLGFSLLHFTEEKNPRVMFMLAKVGMDEQQKMQ